ncbi:sensor histidine kinase [Microbispora bryophytorum]|uniref:sensor histidine kinase n=1 Tax=Microbispora bryophytorum TaxID=1460882 RepID=UPI00371D1DCD
MISPEATPTEAHGARDQAGLIASRATASLSGTPTLRDTFRRSASGAQSTLMPSKLRFVVSAAVTLAVLFAAMGVSLIGTGHLSWLSSLISVTAVVYLAVAFVGAAILRTQPRSRTGWIFLISGTAAPIGTGLNAAADAGARIGRIDAAAWLHLVQTPFAVLSVPLMATFGILLFPDRRLDTRRRRVLGRVYAVELLVLLVWGLLSPDPIDLPGIYNPIAVPGADALVISILLLGPLSLPACISLLRFARRDTGPYTPALRTAARVSFVVPASYIACVIAGFTSGDTAPIAVLENCAAIAVGVAAWIGIVRHGLLNTRVVLNRALVYGSVSLALVAVYLIVVVSLGLFFGGLMPQIVAAIMAALVVLPLRDLVQRRINQLVYGLRDNPAAAFARLGDRLDAAGAPEEILPAAVRTVAEALRLPYVAIEVGGEVLCRHGRALPGETEALPLPFAGETIGHLVLQTRSTGDFSADERRLLSDLTKQVAVAARAVVLTHALQSSRQRLVTTREEERRRLRRDLHDGLGPTLAGIALGIDTVRRATPPDGSVAELLGRLREATESAVDDIRRLVYDLRPPILDELGLAGAVREQAVRLSVASIDIPETLPSLPAAVEVAAYRIAVEALTNAARHAPGAPVSVQLAVNSRLELSIADGGAGLPDGYRAGVGLNSMRERAAELGGLCVVSRREPCGTIVRAEFPLFEEVL